MDGFALERLRRHASKLAGIAFVGVADLNALLEERELLLKAAEAACAAERATQWTTAMAELDAAINDARALE